jgi:hypothetical protein
MPEQVTSLAGYRTPALRCSANFDHDGSDIAVSLLMVQITDRKSWVCYPRCAEHPADTYERLIGLIHPGQLSYVLPLIERPRQ